MKKTAIIVIIAILSSLFSEIVKIGKNNGLPLFNCISSDENGVELEFSLNQYESESLFENGKKYTKISCWNEGEFLRVGKPHLPRITRLIAVPDDCDFSLEIDSIQEKIISDILVYPRQELQSENELKERKFTIDTEFYNNGNVFPEVTAEVGKAAVLRDFRVVPVTVNPFLYDPKLQQLHIITNLSLRINFIGKDGKNPKRQHHKLSRNFQALYQSTIANYDFFSARESEFQQPSYLFIYPDDSLVETNLEILAEWSDNWVGES
jgi:hypothetical protein